MVPLAVAGFITGLLVGLTGVGAGSVLTPLLLFMGVNPAVAVGSDMLSGAVTKGLGTWHHFRRGSVNWDWVVRLALGSVPGVLAGAALLHRVGGALGPAADGVIRHVVGLVLVATAGIGFARELWRLWRLRRRPAGGAEPAGGGQPGAGQPGDGQPGGGQPAGGTPGWVATAAGAAIGLVAGFTSAGSGPLVAMALLAFSRLAPRQVIGTDLAHGVLLFGAGAIMHWGLGSVNLPLTATLLAGSIPGVLLGSRLAYRAPGPVLRLAVNAAVVAAGISLA